MLQAKGDADVEIAKVAIAMSASKSTTLIGDGTYLLLLLYHKVEANYTELYFRSDKAQSYVYKIKVLNQILGAESCNGVSPCINRMRCYHKNIWDWKEIWVSKNHQKDEGIKELCKVFCLPRA